MGGDAGDVMGRPIGRLHRRGGSRAVEKLVVGRKVRRRRRQKKERQAGRSKMIANVLLIRHGSKNRKLWLKEAQVLVDGQKQKKQNYLRGAG